MCEVKTSRYFYLPGVFKERKQRIEYNIVNVICVVKYRYCRGLIAC
jgi:hypothetical protein